MYFGTSRQHTTTSSCPPAIVHLDARCLKWRRLTSKPPLFRDRPWPLGLVDGACQFGNSFCPLHKKFIENVVKYLKGIEDVFVGYLVMCSFIPDPLQCQERATQVFSADAEQIKPLMQPQPPPPSFGRFKPLDFQPVHQCFKAMPYMSRGGRRRAP